jgi:signal transduction histidine kinase
VIVRELFDWIWIGIDLFVAIWFASLAARGPNPLMHGPFAILAASLGASHASSLWMLHASDVAACARAQDWFTVSVVLATAAWVDLGTSLAGTRRQMPKHAWLFAGVGICVALTGMAHDPSYRVADPMPLASVNGIGLLVLAIAMTFSLLTVARIALAARRAPDLRPVVIGLLIPAVLTLWDLIARAGDFEFGHISGVLRGLVVLVLAQLLLRRFLVAEQQLVQKSTELVASTQRLAEAQAELDRTEHLAAVGELSAVIAHEIKHPLAVLQQAAEALESAGPEQAPDLLEVLNEEADRLNRLVDDVLVYARPLTPEANEVDLVEVVTHATRLALDGQPTARNIVVDWEPSEASHWVRGDGTLIRHALINILDNAILAMPSGGTVVVRMQEVEVRGAAGVAVEFTDEGEGMDTMVRERAKDPFFTTRETGTGLGLAIVDRVARVHGGQVTFASQSGRGTTVTFAVPTRARASAFDLEKLLPRNSLPLPFAVEPEQPD